MGASNYTGNLRTNNAQYQGHLPDVKLSAGSLAGKVEVVIDSRTRIYVRPGRDTEEVRQKYLDHMNRYHYLDGSANTVTL